MSPNSATDLVKEARQQIENLAPRQVHEEESNGRATLIDIREREERNQSGSIPQSVHASRGRQVRTLKEMACW